jgi:hypothetical protein
MCNSSDVRRMPSAPRLNLSAASAPSASASQTERSERSERSSRSEASAPLVNTSSSPVEAPADGPVTPIALQRQVMQAVRQLIANTEDVGERFAEEARRIHYGETEARGIRGQATPDEAQALAEEGIDVVALAVPDALKDPLQ